ncbi:MAG TPA: hypothetical protein VG123_07210 [Streptosporangiaceae bacterium]|nr:hypothetical protein [Streptosporangiaceae bacterium]
MSWLHAAVTGAAADPARLGELKPGAGLGPARAAVTGILAGIRPARRAARLNMISAIAAT